MIKRTKRRKPKAKERKPKAADVLIILENVLQTMYENPKVKRIMQDDRPSFDKLAKRKKDG